MLGSQLTHFPSHLVLLSALRRYHDCSPGEETEAWKGHRSKVTIRWPSKFIGIEVSLTSQALVYLLCLPALFSEGGGRCQH